MEKNLFAAGLFSFQNAVVFLLTQVITPSFDFIGTMNMLIYSSLLRCPSYKCTPVLVWLDMLVSKIYTSFIENKLTW